MLVDRTGRVVAADLAAVVGMRLPRAQTLRLDAVFDGKTILVSPFAPERNEAFGSGVGPPQAVMFFAAPMLTGAAQPAAVLGFRVPIARDFTRILSIARLGNTGETYAFDADGRLLSESRFEDHLQAAGLLKPGLKSTLNVEIRDPGATRSKATLRKCRSGRGR